MASNLEVGGVKASGGAETNITVKSSAANCFYELGETTGTKSWRIKASGGNLYFQHDASNADFTSGSNLLTVSSAGVATFSNGIAFQSATTGSGTGTGYTLDSYEEGTWTPGVSFGGGVVGITYSALSGTYVKVGSLVTVGAYIQMSAKGSSTGTARLTGLPFTALAGAVTHTLSFNYASSVNSFTGATADVSAGSTTAVIRLLGASTTAAATEANVNNSTSLFISGSYRV